METLVKLYIRDYVHVSRIRGLLIKTQQYNIHSQKTNFILLYKMESNIVNAVF